MTQMKNQLPDVLNIINLKHHLGIATMVSSDEHDEISAAEDKDVNPNLLKTQEDVTTWFWSKRQAESRRWIWLVMASIVPIQLIVLLNPANTSAFVTNLVYTIQCAIIMALVFTSYYKKNNGCLIFSALALMTVRLSLRFFDFE